MIFLQKTLRPSGAETVHVYEGGITNGIFDQTWHRVLSRERKVNAMAEMIKFRRRRGGDPQAEERRQLLEGMAQTKTLLNQAYAQFNVHSDPDLVDACVYEINALRSRYSYLVRQVKRLDEQREGAG